jgi:hypothetical protein
MSDEQTDMGSKPDEKEDDVLYEGDDANEGEEINWNEEADNLHGWFTPPQGTTEVVFMDDGVFETRDYEGEEREVAVFAVEVDGARQKWSVTKASSPSSLFGQLARFAKAQDGLAGESVTLIRNGKGTDTQYTVQEAADL